MLESFVSNIGPWSNQAYIRGDQPFAKENISIERVDEKN